MGGVIEPRVRDWFRQMAEAAEASKRVDVELDRLAARGEMSRAALSDLGARADDAAEEIARLAHLGVEVGAFDLIADLFDLIDKADPDAARRIAEGAA